MAGEDDLRLFFLIPMLDGLLGEVLHRETPAAETR